MNRRFILAVSCLALVACATQHASEASSSTYDARKALAKEMVARAQWAEAFTLTDKLHREHPEDAEVLTLRSIIYREQGLRSEALADAQQAVKIAPKLAGAHSALAIIHDAEGNGADALEHHRRASELDPQNANYLNNLAFSIFAHGDARKSIPIFRQALRLDPVNARIRNNLGFAYAKLGDFRSAADQFDRGGSPAVARNNLGYAYESQGNLAQAFELYAEAARLDPELQRARVNLEKLARTLGKPLPPGVPNDGHGESRAKPHTQGG